MMNREEPLGRLFKDDERVQYDGHDMPRIEALGADFTRAAMGLITSLGAYGAEGGTEADEDAAYRMKIARQNLVYDWAVMQLVLSKIGWGIRIDTDEAYRRLTEDKEPSMEGL